MALFKRRTAREAPGPGDVTAPPRTVLAAAMPMSGPDVARVNRARNTETVEAWQKDAWYFFDAVGELRAPVTYIANACSQATPFAAEIDPDTQLVTGPTEDERVQRAAAMVLGGATHRAQLLQTIAVCWQVPGELFLIIRPQAPRGGAERPDEWLVLSGQKVTAKGNVWEYIDPATLLPVRLGRQDRLMRVWSPHPNDQAKADTAVRPALPTLREIEKTSAAIAARLDSRLASNGILPFPQEADFPLGTNPDGSPMSKATSVASFLMEAMTASMDAPGTAAAQAPIVFTMPSELIDVFSKGWMDLSSQLDSATVELRADALSRLAGTLDMPKDVAAGTQSQANHWGSWQVEESTYKIYIEPLLQRVGDAVSEYWFRPVLTAMGVTDPERFVIDWDTSAIVKRPDATEDLNWLYERRLISDDYRRAQSGIPDEAVPDDDETQRRLLTDIVSGAPSLAADPTVSRELFGFEVAPAAAGVSQDAIEGGDGSGSEAQPGDARALPATQDAQAEPEGVPNGLTASAELMVFDALQRAGGRLLTAGNRGRYRDVPRFELHTVISVDQPAALLAAPESFQFAGRVAEEFGVSPVALEGALRGYALGLLTSGRKHDREALRAVLRGVWGPR